MDFAAFNSATMRPPTPTPLKDEDEEDPPRLLLAGA
jgi:hypothetical protein